MAQSRFFKKQEAHINELMNSLINNIMDKEVTL